MQSNSLANQELEEFQPDAAPKDSVKTHTCECSCSNSVRANIENPRGNLEKLSPNESVKGAHTVLRGSVRASEGFSESKPEAAKPRGAQPPSFAVEGLPSVTLLKGYFFHTAPRIFNSCLEYQSNEVHLR